MFPEHGPAGYRIRPTITRHAPRPKGPFGSQQNQRIFVGIQSIEKETRCYLWNGGNRDPFCRKGNYGVYFTGIKKSIPSQRKERLALSPSLSLTFSLRLVSCNPNNNNSSFLCFEFLWFSHLLDCYLLPIPTFFSFLYSKRGLKYSSVNKKKSSFPGSKCKNSL
jgi:hypothetical protein